MLKLDIDVEMKDGTTTSTTASKTYGASTDDDLRSPRTPTYVPTSPSFLNLPIFDPSRIIPGQNSTVKETKPSDSRPPEPAKPLAWVWQCHLCKSRYPLSATRRCLQDGHFYCSGETDRPNLKKKKKGQSCSSEFDYIGWREWGEWKRKVLGPLENNVNAQLYVQGCGNCEFPSQCRYTSSRMSEERTAADENKTTVLSTSHATDQSKISSSKKQGKKSRFYSTELVTFDSICAFDTIEQSERLQLSGPDSQVDANPQTGSPSRKLNAMKSTSTPPDVLINSAETTSRKKSTLSPITEESFFNTDVTNTSMIGRALKGWNESVEIGFSKKDIERIDFT